MCKTALAILASLATLEVGYVVYLNMDSEEDNTKQLNKYHREEDFCELPSCLGNTWHDWGCCSSATHSSCTCADCETDLFDPGWSLDNAVEALLSNAVEALLSGHKQEETAPAQPTSRRYTIPVTDVDVAKARVESVPKKPREGLILLCESMGSAHPRKDNGNSVQKEQASPIKCYPFHWYYHARLSPIL